MLEATHRITLRTGFLAIVSENSLRIFYKRLLTAPRSVVAQVKSQTAKERIEAYTNAESLTWHEWLAVAKGGASYVAEVNSAAHLLVRHAEAIMKDVNAPSALINALGEMTWEGMITALLTETELEMVRRDPYLAWTYSTMRKLVDGGVCIPSNML